MKTVGLLTITTPNDTDILMTRSFDAPRQLVYEAYTRPELVQRWLGVFGGWSLDVCEIDLRVGGQYRYVWRKDGHEMRMGGVYHEIVPGRRIVATERFDDPWYEGEGLGTIEFIEKDGKTTLSMNMTYPSKAVRDGVLASPMETGVAASFDLLAEQLAAAARR